jgi:predicted Zn-dependent protease
VELRRVAAEPARDESAMGYAIRALVLEQSEDNALEMAIEMEKLAEQALKRDPNCVPALVLLTRALNQQIDYDVHVDRDRVVRRMNDLTKKAVRLDASQPTIWVFRALTLMLMGQWNAALEASARCLALEPYSSGLTLHHAALTTLSGRPAEAIVLAEKALALDPRVDTQSTIGEALLLLGKYRDAVESLEKAKGRGLDEVPIDLFLAAAYAQTGDAENAAAARAEVLRVVPGYTIAGHKSKGYSMNPEYIRLAEAHLYEGMRKAGFAEE